MPKVCVIGAGISGLSSAKNLLEAGITPCVFELASEIGGLWVYNDKVGLDKYGLPVHSSLYEGLWTNFPKEIMQLPGLDFEPELNSFLPSEKVIDYLQKYARKFLLDKYIKLNHLVQNVKPEGNGWVVSYKNLCIDEKFVEEFDYVMVCIGHYSVPRFPDIKGFETFNGEVMHSHDFKNSKKFVGKTVVVQGGGPSGVDIAMELTNVCKKVYFSHHMKGVPKMYYAANLELKPDIEEIQTTSLKFVDGSHHEIDTILFCTGYLYNYPLLDPSCKINVDNDCVQPLYKHLVNIEYPTMCIVGIPFFVCGIPMMDLQVRYFVETIKGNLKLPSKEAMYLHTNEYFTSLWEKGVKKRHAHNMNPNQKAYYDSLSEEAKIKGLPPVFGKIHQEVYKLFYSNFKTARKHNFTILDDDNFECRAHSD